MALKKRQKKTGKKLVAVSGGFDPLHIGHVRMFENAKALGDSLVVIINSDEWLMRKKGFVFMKEKERAEIIKALACVDEVYIHHSKTAHVAGALAKLQPKVFANGGDRRNTNDIPEAATCTKLDIEMVFNVGDGKIQSSSWLTKSTHGEKK